MRLSITHHDDTRRVYPGWVKERTGSSKVAPDWTAISPREILELSEKQFDAAEVPHGAREEYYRVFTQYIYGLK
jgi:hypothetical protein